MNDRIREEPMHEYLIGYDVKMAADSYVADTWDAFRRERLLLRPEIAWPLSVDWWVWPSVFCYDSDDSYTVALEGMEQLGSDPIDFVHAFVGLWQDVDEMQRWIRERSELLPDVVPVAISLTNRSSRLPEWWDALGDDTEVGLREPPLDFRFLGFDVADEWRTSGLSNTGLDEEDMARVRARFGDHLNEFGLFEDHVQADEFRAACDVRVPEHSPYFVYSIHGRFPT